MSTFKRGDRVRLLVGRPQNGSDWPFVPAGSVGTVTSTEIAPQVTFDSGEVRYCNDSILELVEPEAPPAVIELATVTLVGRREGQDQSEVVIDGDALSDAHRFHERVIVRVEPAVIDRVAVGRQYKLALVELAAVDKA